MVMNRDLPYETWVLSENYLRLQEIAQCILKSSIKELGKEKITGKGGLNEMRSLWRTPMLTDKIT